jgi:hypothetical protein
MRSKHLISVVIPFGYFCPEFEDSVNSAAQECTDRDEIIIVTNGELAGKINASVSSKTTVLISETPGRGHYCFRGARVAKGDIILFLHADTILPAGWRRSVTGALKDPGITGGGFTTRFYPQNLYLKLVPKGYNVFSRVIGEIWGDRAIFIRRDVLDRSLYKIDVPIMEDVHLSRMIRTQGRMIILKESVTTSSLHFQKKGHLIHTLQALYLRILYSLGVSEQTIFEKYYRNFDLPTPGSISK